MTPTFGVITPARLYVGRFFRFGRMAGELLSCQNLLRAVDLSEFRYVVPIHH